MNLTTIERADERHTRFGSTALIILVGWIDYVTGLELRVFPLYFLPIALVTWRSGRGAGMGMALFADAVWFVSNEFAGMTSSAPYIVVGNVLSYLFAFCVIAWLTSEQREALLRERELARNDALTALLNVRGFYERAAQEIERSHRNGAPLTLAVLDLDHFKDVNDNHGHAAGDRMLVEVAETLKRRLRATDIAARMGGDEFAILMPDTRLAGAGTVLESLRAGIHSVADAHAYPVTASVGACEFLRAPDSLDTMLAAADSAMYEVKHGGRNRVLLKETAA